MATWRNGSAFGFDRHAYCDVTGHQKVAGSSPAVVMIFCVAQERALQYSEELGGLSRHAATLQNEEVRK